MQCIPVLCEKNIKDVINRMHSDYTLLSKSEKREKINKPTTQESSSPSGGECEICAIVFFSLNVY